MPSDGLGVPKIYTRPIQPLKGISPLRVFNDVAIVEAGFEYIGDHSGGRGDYAMQALYEKAVAWRA